MGYDTICKKQNKTKKNIQSCWLGCAIKYKNIIKEKKK